MAIEGQYPAEDSDLSEDMNSVKIPLRNRKGDIIGTTLIDLKDKPAVEKHRWHLTDTGYARSRINRKSIRLHRFLLGQVDGDIDHINRNKLDNRRKNLRVVSRAINNLNRIGTGVSWDKANHKWRATIKINGKQKSLGRHKKRADAVAARNRANKLFKTYGQAR